MSVRNRLLALRAALVLSVLAPLAAAAGEITVSAAASLSNALRDIAPLFEAARPGSQVHLNFGASGALLAQIAKGAPADVFISADVESMDQAQRKGLVRAGTRRNVVSNMLVAIVPVGASQVPATLGDLARPAYTRIAVGLPASVPVGRYTRDVLDGAGLWGAVQARMIGASSVRQALDYVARAEVDAGFVYATDAALMPDKVKIAFTVPTPQPIVYPAAALTSAPNAAEAGAFVSFLFTPAARAVFERYGFGKP